MLNYEQLVEMELHSEIFIEGIGITIIRVPNGWIYKFFTMEEAPEPYVFVPEKL